MNANTPALAESQLKLLAELEAKQAELSAAQANITAQIQAFKETQKGEAIKTCKALIEEFSLTAFDLGLILTRESNPLPVQNEEVKRAIKHIPPKYRGPNGDLWSGRGLQPKWFDALINQGAKKEDFLIIKQEAAPAVVQNDLVDLVDANDLVDTPKV